LAAGVEEYSSNLFSKGDTVELPILIPLLDRIKGTTFATIDSVTWANRIKSVRCVRNGSRVILFRTKGCSGYEGMVKRALAEAGKNPDGFSVGPLPWGERVDDLPLIKNKDEYYLQVIELSPGDKRYFIGTTDVQIQPSELEMFGIKDRFNSNQDLPPDDQVRPSCYNIKSLRRIALMGEEIFDTAVSDLVGGNILPIGS
jgi:hypothetical protein